MPAASARGSLPVAGLLSIGQVLARLTPEFTTLTTSKLRFLEVQGIVGLPPKEDEKVAPGKKTTKDSKREAEAAESPGAVEAAEPIEEERPVSLGELRVLIAVRPPTKRTGADGAGEGSES